MLNIPTTGRISKQLINQNNNNSIRDNHASKNVSWSSPTGETVVEIKRPKRLRYPNGARLVEGIGETNRHSA